MNAPITSYLFQEDLYNFTTPVVVVLSKTWESYSNEEQLLLNKILTSVKVDVNAVQIVAQPVIELAALQIYSPEKVLIFGSATTEDIGLYQSASAQGFIVVRADDLSLLDDQKKKNLWIALRQMFGL